MQRQEQPNNTPEQVREYLRGALAVLDEIDPPAELREAVFTQAVSLISGKQIIFASPQPVDLSALGLKAR
jgi:hypothetical protein